MTLPGPRPHGPRLPPWRAFTHRFSKVSEVSTTLTPVPSDGCAPVSRSPGGCLFILEMGMMRGHVYSIALSASS